MVFVANDDDASAHLVNHCCVVNSRLTEIENLCIQSIVSIFLSQLLWNGDVVFHPVTVRQLTVRYDIVVKTFSKCCSNLPQSEVISPVWFSTPPRDTRSSNAMCLPTAGDKGVVDGREAVPCSPYATKSENNKQFFKKNQAQEMEECCSWHQQERFQY